MSVLYSNQFYVALTLLSFTIWSPKQVLKKNLNEKSWKKELNLKGMQYIGYVET